MKNQLESAFQKEVIAYLKEHKIWHYRTQMGAQSGLPDIIACFNGKFVGLELKRPDGKGEITLQQLKVISDICISGGIAIRLESLKGLELLYQRTYYGR